MSKFKLDMENVHKDVGAYANSDHNIPTYSISISISSIQCESHISDSDKIV